jgi:hypothetical protein
MKTTANRQTVITAINTVNEYFGYHIELNRDDQTGKWYNFTLKSKSGIPGARISVTGRNLPCASWHAHGYVFEAIFKIEPDAIIWSAGEKIESGFERKDRNVGSIMYPMFFSETSIL